MSDERDDFEDDEQEQDEGEDSPVIKALRDQVKTLSKELKSARTAASKAADEARGQMQRELAAREVVSGLGFPKLASLVVEQVEGDIDEDNVRSFLEGLGLLGEDQEQPESSQTQADSLSTVASLGQRVANAASGTTQRTIEQRLQEAQSVAEVDAIMREAGLAQD